MFFGRMTMMWSGIVIKLWWAPVLMPRCHGGVFQSTSSYLRLNSCLDLAWRLFESMCAICGWSLGSCSIESFWYGVQPGSIFPDKHWMRQCARTFHVRCKPAFCLVHFSLQYHWLTWLIYPDLIRDEQMRCPQCWNASWFHGMMFLNRFICSSVSLMLQSRTSSSSCLLVTAIHYSKSLKKGFELAYWLLVGGLYVHHVNSLCACPFVCTAQASAWLVLAAPCWTAVIWYWPLEILGNLALT
jgi:hypothetical protein